MQKHPVGWRAWSLMHPHEQSNDMALYSPHFPVRWPAGEPFIACCEPGGYNRSHPWCEGDRCPHELSLCGIHAYRTLEQLVLSYGPSYVLGQVQLGGRIVVHEAGWRASEAYPVELYVDERLMNRAASLSAMYDVPVRSTVILQVKS